MQQPDFAGFAERVAERQAQLDSGRPIEKTPPAAQEAVMGAPEDSVRANDVAWQALRRVLPAESAILNLDAPEKQLSFTGQREILGPYGAIVLADVAVTATLRETKENHELLQQAQQIPDPLRPVSCYRRRRDAAVAAQRLREAELEWCQVRLSAPLYRADPTSEVGRYEEEFTTARVSPLEALTAQPATANSMDAFDATAKTIQFATFLEGVNWSARSPG